MLHHPEIARAQAFDLLFLGDSITETWRGTDMGRVCRRCAGVADVFRAYFGSRYNAEVLAVGGDQIAHLHWRLLHGETPAKQQPKVCCVFSLRVACVLCVGCGCDCCVAGCRRGCDVS